MFGYSWTLLNPPTGFPKPFTLQIPDQTNQLHRLPPLLLHSITVIFIARECLLKWLATSTPRWCVRTLPWTFWWPTLPAKLRSKWRRARSSAVPPASTPALPCALFDAYGSGLTVWPPLRDTLVPRRPCGSSTSDWTLFSWASLARPSWTLFQTLAACEDRRGLTNPGSVTIISCCFRDVCKDVSVECCMAVLLILSAIYWFIYFVWALVDVHAGELQRDDVFVWMFTLDPQLDHQLIGFGCSNGYWILNDLLVCFNFVKKSY